MLNRRAFLTRAALAAAAVPALGAAVAPAYKLRYLVSAAMYGKAPLEQMLAEVSKTGTPYVDLWPLPHGNHREQMAEMGEEKFQSLMARHGVKLGCITRYDLGPFNLADELALVKRLGGEVIVTGAKGPKNVTGAEARRAVAEFIEKLKPTAEAAEAHGVTVAVENHAGSLLSSVDSIRYFAELSKSPRIGLAFAPHHLPQDGAMHGRLITELGPAVKFYYAQQEGKGSRKTQPVEDELLQMPGRGELDFGPAVAALKRMNYQGFFEIFMHPFPRGRPILQPVSAVTAEIHRARAHVEKLLASA